MPKICDATVAIGNLSMGGIAIEDIDFSSQGGSGGGGGGPGLPAKAIVDRAGEGIVDRSGQQIVAR